MKNDTGFKTNTGLLVLALILALFVIIILWTASQIAEVLAETESSVDALENVVATAAARRATSLDNAHATGTALGMELDSARATATARAAIPTLAPAPTSAPVWPISIEQCDSYEPPDRAEHIIESEIEFFILSYEHLLSAITLTSCAENYGEPYFEWLQYYILHGLEQLDWGLTVIDPEWPQNWMEQFPTPQTDQG